MGGIENGESARRAYELMFGKVESIPELITFFEPQVHVDTMVGVRLGDPGGFDVNRFTLVPEVSMLEVRRVPRVSFSGRFDDGFGVRWRLMQGFGAWMPQNGLEEPSVGLTTVLGDILGGRNWGHFEVPVVKQAEGVVSVHRVNRVLILDIYSQSSVVEGVSYFLE